MIKEVDILGGLKVLSRLRLEFYFKSLIYLIILPLWLNKGEIGIDEKRKHNQTSR